MDVKNTININEPCNIDFEVERTPVRLGKSNRYFYIDFNDFNFPSRLDKARKEIISFLNKYKDLTTKKLSADESIKLIDDVDKNIRSAINNAFGYDVCSDVFGIASVISVNKNGECYYEMFFNSLLPLVEKQYNVRIDKLSTRTRSYLAQKGKYSNNNQLHR